MCFQELTWLNLLATAPIFFYQLQTHTYSKVTHSPQYILQPHFHHGSHPGAGVQLIQPGSTSPAALVERTANRCYGGNRGGLKACPECYYMCLL